MKMTFAISALAAVLTLSACETASEDPVTDRPLSGSGQLTAEPNRAGVADSESDAFPNSIPDGESISDRERASLGILNAINAHEIAAGNQALGKGVSGKIADYAREMVDEHTRNRETTNTMNPLETALLAADQIKKGEMELQKLASQEGEAYQKAYAEAMVNDHTEALATLDGKLIPSASTPAVASHLRETRSVIAKHLEEARTLQDSK